MLYAYLLALAAEVPVPSVPEPVTDGLWAFGRDLSILILAALTCWWTVLRPWWKSVEKKRQAERAAHDKARRDEFEAVAESVVAPLRAKVEEIHHTTHTNGNADKPKTLRDEVGAVGVKVDAAIGAIGAIAVNQATLADRFDAHEQDAERFLRNARAALAKQGVHLPELEQGDSGQ